MKPSRKVADRFAVYINGKFAASVTSDRLAQLRLQKGRQLSESEYQELLDDLENGRLREAAFRLLSYRSRSEKELTDRLLRKGFQRSKVDALLAEFREKGLISDRRFAEEWVDNRMRLNPRSRRLLVMELRAKGIDKETAESVVEERLAGIDEAEIAFELLSGRLERFRQDKSIDTKRKINNYLRYRGFGMSDILHATERFFKEFDEQ